MARAKPFFYAVAKGRQPGIFTEWERCKAQILNYNGAKYKKFQTLSEAETWIARTVGPDIACTAMQGYLSLRPTTSDCLRQEITPAPRDSQLASPIPPSTGSRISSATAVRLPQTRTQETTSTEPTETSSMPVVPPTGESWVVYSDGSCRGNGKPGSVAGIGVWWGKDHRWNLSERCPGDQTNNRAELIAIIRVLETAPKDRRPLFIKTDSQYSIGCFREWIAIWKRNGWRNAKGGAVANIPLIKYIDALLEERRKIIEQPVDLIKVRGHSGDEGNDGADLLANQGATMPEVPERDWDEIHPAVASGPRLPTAPCPQSQPLAAPLSVGKDAFQAQNTSVKATPVPSAKYSPSPGVVAPYIPKGARVPPEETVFGDPNKEFSPEELNAYAECWLSDDQFLREARDSGVS
ncbi:ribonuclease H-like domain-containing protein [Trametes maxima]|nr:ribonuclease H-like domain-containing protein [Trametes maxima]